MALIAEVISNKDLAAQSWCLFPLSPGCQRFFWSEPLSAGNSSRPTRQKFQNLEFDVCLIMDQLEKSGLEDLLGPDKIHLSKQGAGFIKAMISKHLNK